MEPVPIGSVFSGCLIFLLNNLLINKEMERNRITVETIVALPVEKVWKRFVSPEDIVKWYSASDEWHTPAAENDLRKGGKFSYRMEAKDGSAGFDFWGIYDVVQPFHDISFTLGDDRKVEIRFKAEDVSTRITETFEAEEVHPLEMQQQGWQAILDNFKKYAEQQNGTAIKQITPCLWFDSKAEEAARFYVSVFPGSSLDSISYYTAEGQEIHGQSPGSVLTVVFTLNGQPFTALNGGPLFTFSEAVSFQIFCDTQQEIDYYWNKLTEGGEESACGWLKDKFGVSWQVVPSVLPSLIAQRDKAEKVTKAFMQMKKFDIETLLNA